MYLALHCISITYISYIAYTVCAYLLPGGRLLRDGSETKYAAEFLTGGAAGYLEVVSWEGDLVWCFSHSPYFDALTHHDFEPMPNGNVLIMVWERKEKEEALQAGRRPNLIPDNEVIRTYTYTHTFFFVLRYETFRYGIT